MIYQITIDKKVKKQLLKLPKYFYERFKKELKEIAQNSHNGKHLKHSLKNHFSWRTGDFRIIYKINDTNKTVYIELIGHRKEIYNIIRRLLAILFSI